ncbi:MAG: hybrid sensor histidine kinase/response regulator, partial [Beggiatoa sp. IS2]
MKPTLDTLLIVDDMLDNVEVLHDFLKGKGFRILVACSGEDAIETAEYALPNLILLDVMMPDIDGFTVCQHLKSQTITQEIPIIFMTALADT